jgi:hypothetical protein
MGAASTADVAFAARSWVWSLTRAKFTTLRNPPNGAERGTVLEA